FSSRRRHTRFSRDWSSDVCSSDLGTARENEFSALMAALRPRLDAELARVWSAQLAKYRRHGESVQQTLSAARDLCLRGGKRLREIGRASCRGRVEAASAAALVHTT